MLPTQQVHQLNDAADSSHLPGIVVVGGEPGQTYFGNEVTCLLRYVPLID